MLAVAREVEADLTDVLRVRELPHELADFEGAGSCRPQRVQPQGDAYPLIAAEADGLEAVLRTC